jgi:ABC-type multidrug transport system fused ATPase/permease subunit
MESKDDDSRSINIGITQNPQESNYESNVELTELVTKTPEPETISTPSSQQDISAPSQSIDKHGSTKFSMIQKFQTRVQNKVTSALTARCSANQAYIEALEKLLIEHGIPLPDRTAFIKLEKSGLRPRTVEGYVGLLNEVGIWTMAPKQKIPTVGTALKGLFFGSGPKVRIDVLKGVSGRILPGKLTLLLGPPGSGKSVFLKTLCGRMTSPKLHIDGEIYYNNETIKSDKFLVPKVVEYIEQNDTHAPTLTVEETITYAWMCTSGGHHNYGVTDRGSVEAETLNRDDESKTRVSHFFFIYK